MVTHSPKKKYWQTNPFSQKQVLSKSTDKVEPSVSTFVLVRSRVCVGCPGGFRIWCFVFDRYPIEMRTVRTYGIGITYTRSTPIEPNHSHSSVHKHSMMTALERQRLGSDITGRGSPVPVRRFHPFAHCFCRTLAFGSDGEAWCNDKRELVESSISTCD